MVVPNTNDALGQIDYSILGKFEQLPVTDDKFSRVEPVSGADRRYVDLEIAHEALDDFRAQAVLGGQTIASRRRELSS
jgi:hypothetical protein